MPLRPLSIRSLFMHSSHIFKISLCDITIKSNINGLHTPYSSDFILICTSYPMITYDMLMNAEYHSSHTDCDCDCA